MLPLRREAVVARDHRPAIRQQLHIPLTGVDHRLDGEGHACAQFETGAGLAVVQHLRVFVVDATDAVAAVLAHDGETLGFGRSLDRVADVTEARTRAHAADSLPHRLETALDQPLRVRQRLADEIHAAGVAVEAVADDRDVDVDDVAVLQAFVVRDAVAHHMVDRAADGFGETTVVEVRGDGLLHLHDVVVAEAVELVGGDPGFHMLADHVEHLGGEAARFTHFLLLFGGLQGDRHGGGRGGPEGSVGEGADWEAVKRCFYGFCMV